jgi:acyl-homoserine lactone acylase PvdQ
MRRSLPLALFLAALLALPSTRVAADVTTVREPAFGIPHIHGDTDAEVFFEYGRQVARDRLGQIVLLARFGRGTAAELFGQGALGSDIGTRSVAYSSSELNDMFAKLPPETQAAYDAYIAGVNAEINAVLSGPLGAMPVEVGTAVVLGLGDNLFGNKNNISDQVDPGYSPVTQFTRELSVAQAILQTRNFGSSSGFGNEFTNLENLTRLQAKFGPGAGFAIFNDLHFLNDPLSPVSVPDPRTPGFGGPLSASRDAESEALVAHAEPRPRLFAALRLAPARLGRALGAWLFGPARALEAAPPAVADRSIPRLPRYAYAQLMDDLRARAEAREQQMRKMSSWPAMGSYMWAIDGGRSKGGQPWLAGMPQTGVQTPSIMHAVELSSAEGDANRVQAVGMAFIGGPSILIGHTRNTAWTTTTAGLKNTSLVAEVVVSEDTDNVRYLDEGTPTPMARRTERFNILFGAPELRTFFRTHVRLGNGGSRPVAAFIGDADGSARPGSNAVALVTSGGLVPGTFTGGYALLTQGPGAGQIRQILDNDSVVVFVATPFTVSPVADETEFVLVQPGNPIIAVAVDFVFWREETATARAFSLFQRTENVLDARRAVRQIATTHNFNAVDNGDFNGVGSDDGGRGNFGYWSAGFSPKRQGGVDPRLPIDGTGPNPLTVFEGTVTSASADTLTDAAAPFGQNLSALPINFAYDNPGELGAEFILKIVGGAGLGQTRRIASNSADTLTLEEPWGVVPSPGDLYEVMEVIAMPEAINPGEGYTANWNGKASVATTPASGREFRHIFILERLGLEIDADREFSRQLNKDVAGINPEKIGRYLLPRLRDAVDALGDQGDPRVLPTLEALEANSAFPIDERRFIDPVTATEETQEPVFLQEWVDQMADAVFGDELSGTGAFLNGGSRGRRAHVTHVIDFAAGDVVGSLPLSRDYLNGADYRQMMIDAFIAALDDLGGIPAPIARRTRNYVHPFGIAFPSTTRGNRGTYQQIVQVDRAGGECGGSKGEMIFPLGQSGFIPFEGPFDGGPPGANTTTLHPIWADWRHVPMLQGGAGLATNGGDSDGNGILDAWECWHFGRVGVKATSRQNGPGDPDGDRLSNAEEWMAGADPRDSDTDDDGVLDGFDAAPQDRQITTPRVPTVEATSDRGRGDGSGTGKDK